MSAKIGDFVRAVQHSINVNLSDGSYIPDNTVSGVYVGTSGNFVLVRYGLEPDEVTRCYGRPEDLFCVPLTELNRVEMDLLVDILLKFDPKKSNQEDSKTAVATATEIIIAKLAANYYDACFMGKSVCSSGKTRAEALGALLLLRPDLANIRITDREDPDLTR